ncbi:MAG: hypothetical protein ACTFAK_16945 [Candidatus Electronema sp. VV]
MQFGDLKTFCSVLFMSYLPPGSVCPARQPIQIAGVKNLADAFCNYLTGRRGHFSCRDAGKGGFADTERAEDRVESRPAQAEIQPSAFQQYDFLKRCFFVRTWLVSVDLDGICDHYNVAARSAKV